MTTTDLPLKSHEAARGARKARLDAIDLAYVTIVAEVNAESRAAWDEAVAASCARIDTAMTGLVVDTTGTLHGHRLRVHLATKRITGELDLMQQEWWGNQFRLALALDEVEACRLIEREPFDFDMTPPLTDAEVIEEILADLASTADECADFIHTQTEGASA